MALSHRLLQRLELEVETRNRVNAKINQASNALKVAFEPFIGCKVQLVNNSLNKKYKALAELVLEDSGLFFMPGGQSLASSYNEGFRFFLDSSEYRLNLEIDVSYSVPGGGVWHYVKGWTSFGLIQDKILTEVLCSTLKADYSFDELLGHIDNLEALSLQVEKAKSETREFTDFTRHIYF